MTEISSSLATVLAVNSAAVAAAGSLQHQQQERQFAKARGRDSERRREGADIKYL